MSGGPVKLQDLADQPAGLFRGLNADVFSRIGQALQVSLHSKRNTVVGAQGLEGRLAI